MSQTHRTIEVSDSPPPTTPAEIVDARQDDAMQRISADGRPPARQLRVREWRLFAIGATLLAVGLAIWLVVAGVSGSVAFVGLLYGAGLLALASPVLLIGSLRAREERKARDEAEAVSPSSPDRR